MPNASISLAWRIQSAATMKIDILTLFPEIALSPLSDSIIRRARDAGLVEIRGHHLRDW